tara:strand:+ start:95 stop:319 length:225 start_codon:yes stop_codon:yes gene_type:complete
MIHTIHTVKEQYAQELGYKNWETCINDQPNYKVEELMDEVALRLCIVVKSLPSEIEIGKAMSELSEIADEELER